MSIDGVNESNSSSRSLQIVSIQFEGCTQVYPCIISRPEIFQKTRMKENFEVYISNFIDELKEADIRLSKVVLDAPERALCRHQKSHGGYFSCDLCYASPENIPIPGEKGSKYIDFV